MKIQNIIIVLLFFISCSSSRFYDNAYKNIEELKDFKNYLKQNYTNDFKENKTIFSNSVKDEKLLYYFDLFKIKSLEIIPKEDFGYYQSNNKYFKDKGNIVRLYFFTTPFFEQNHLMLFDYSKNGLKLKKGANAHIEIMERVFIF